MTTETTDATTIDRMTVRQLKAAAPTVSMTKVCHDTTNPSSNSIVIVILLIALVLVHRLTIESSGILVLGLVDGGEKKKKQRVTSTTAM